MYKKMKRTKLVDLTFFYNNFYSLHFSIGRVSVIPSKPLTLDLMETLDLFFRRAYYH